MRTYKEKSWVVLGQYGVTLASPLENIVDKEVKRLRRLGFSATKLPKPSQKQIPRIYRTPTTVGEELIKFSIINVLKSCEHNSLVSLRLVANSSPYFLPAIKTSNILS